MTVSEHIADTFALGKQVGRYEALSKLTEEILKLPYNPEHFKILEIMVRLKYEVV